MKCWQNGGSKNEYLCVKKAVYNARKVAEQVRFGEVLRRKDNRTEVFKIAKHMCAANHDVIRENCVKNGKGDLAVTDHEKLLAWQEHYERLLNEEFDGNKESLAINNPTIEPRPKIKVDTVRRVLGRMKCGKAAGSSGVVAAMLQASGEVGIGRMTGLFDGILDEYKIPEDWNKSVIFNFFKNKGEATDRGN